MFKNKRMINPLASPFCIKHNSGVAKIASHFTRCKIYLHQFITPEDKFEHNYPFTYVITVENCKNINIDVEPE